MIKRLLIRLVLAGLAVLLLAGQSWSSFNEEYQFGPPTNLGQQINSPYNETNPYLSSDGNTIFFSSDKPGGFGGRDIYFAKRIDGVWQEAQNIGPGINSDRYDYWPVISPDGRKLFFSSSRDMSTDYHTSIWVSENIDGEWQAPVRLPKAVNWSGYNNDVNFITSDGRWLYMSCFSMKWLWDIYRVDMTDPEYSTVELIYRTWGRDIAVAQTFDNRYFILRSSSSGETRVVLPVIDGVPTPPGASVTFPVNQIGFTFGDNDAFAYFTTSQFGGLGGFDIFAAPRTWPCESLDIGTFMGTNKVINPLPLAGQTVDLELTVADASSVHNAVWTLFFDGQVVGSGTGLPRILTWDGRNAGGNIDIGSHELRLVLEGNGGECLAERALPVNLEFTDDCLLQIAFPQ